MLNGEAMHSFQFDISNDLMVNCFYFCHCIHLRSTIAPSEAKADKLLACSTAFNKINLINYELMWKKLLPIDNFMLLLFRTPRNAECRETLVSLLVD